MRYWIGLVTFAFAFGFLAHAVQRRRRVLSVISEEWLTSYLERVSADPKSLSAFGEMVRPIVLFGLAVVGALCVAAYFQQGGRQLLAPVDLAGSLSMLAAYGYLVVVQTRYRMTAVFAAAAQSA